MAPNDDRVVVVTGAARGIGESVVRRLAGAGWCVAAVDIDARGLADLSSSALVEGWCVEPFRADVSDLDAVVGMVDAVQARFGWISALVNNAGIIGSGAPLWEVRPDEWDRILSVDLTSMYYCSRAVIPLMLTAGFGRIVNMASIAGKEGLPFSAAYSAAKAGVIGLTKAMGKELARSGILVNCVTPADIETPIHAGASADERARWAAAIPMGRIGTAAEVAELVAWLVSEECSFSTGAVFDLSGGRSTY
jgi:NAD(P)-dependent dehydrogenase (short-subunit alcohol dehydrogenase family)